MKNREAALDVALLSIRLAVGSIFIVHGYLKFTSGIEHFAKFLGDIGVPAPQTMAYVSAVWELAGGALVLLGGLSRIAALGLAGMMVVAVVKVHLPNGFLLNHSLEPGKGHGYEYAMACGVMALAVAIAGPGQISIDHLIKKKKGH